MSIGERVRVAVVDDSTFIRMAIERMLEDDPQIEMVGSANSGEELLAQLDDWQPDVVTLDLDMPGIGGLATLDQLTARCSTPVIILSTHSGEGAPLTIEALHRGATDFIDKQRYSLVDFGALRMVLLEKIFQVTGVVRHEVPLFEPPPVAEVSSPVTAPQVKLPGQYDVIVMGASTGGPPTLQTILENMGPYLPVPIVIVQHMPKGFTHAFAERLNTHLPFQVCEAEHGEPLLPNTVYIALAGSHLRIARQNDELLAEISAFPQNMIHTPAVDVLFESAARTTGRRTVAALLSGMGNDGAKGMAALKAIGAYTLCQDEASSVVYGMPRAALALNSVITIAPPEEMGERLSCLVEGD